jgi:predicted nucleic acid-binding protein
MVKKYCARYFEQRDDTFDLMKKYRDLPMDLADGTLVVLAETNKIKKKFTLDHRDFQFYRISRNQQFNLLPAHLD